GLAVRAHLDEAEATRAPGSAIGDDGRGRRRPDLGKQLLEVFTGRVEREVADVQLLAHEPSPGPFVGRSRFSWNCLGEVPSGGGGGVRRSRSKQSGPPVL